MEVKFLLSPKRFKGVHRSLVTEEFIQENWKDQVGTGTACLAADVYQYWIKNEWYYIQHDPQEMVREITYDVPDVEKILKTKSWTFYDASQKTMKTACSQNLILADLIKVYYKLNMDSSALKAEFLENMYNPSWYHDLLSKYDGKFELVTNSMVKAWRTIVLNCYLAEKIGVKNPIILQSQNSTGYDHMKMIYHPELVTTLERL